MADVTDSKSVELITRVGSSPTAGIKTGSFAKAELLFSFIQMRNPKVEIEKWKVKIRIDGALPCARWRGLSFNFSLFTFHFFA